MSVSTSNEFLELLEKSNLLSADQLGDVRRLAQKSDGADPTKLARHLARRELLTRWQAGQLLAGRSSFHLGKYKLLDLLGRGGMGSVFLAEHVTMNRRVALKVLSKEIGKTPGSLERFLAEARAVAALDHPNIVHAYNVDCEGDRYYIVMEYVDGIDLARLVAKEGPLDYYRAADYIRQVADGLTHAHQHHVIHCDIKPSNLLVNKQGVVKILDMGLARMVGGAEPPLPDEEGVVGSVDYLAPEQALKDHDFDHRADIYSLGCTLYFLLMGHPPFPEGTLPERIIKHQTQTPKNIAEQRPDAPARLVQVCEKMMAKRPEERYQSAAEVSRVLGDWLSAQPAQGRGKDVRGKVKPPLTRAKSPHDMPPAEAEDSLDTSSEEVKTSPVTSAAREPRKQKKQAAAAVAETSAVAPAGEAGRTKLSLAKNPRLKLLGYAAVALLLLAATISGIIFLPRIYAVRAAQDDQSAQATAGEHKQQAPPHQAKKRLAELEDEISESATEKKSSEATTLQSSSGVEPGAPVAKETGKQPGQAEKPADKNGGEPIPSTEEPNERPSEKPADAGEPREPIGEIQKPAEKPAEEPPTKPEEPAKPAAPPSPPPPPKKPKPFESLAKAVQLPEFPKEASVAGGEATLGTLHLEEDTPLTVNLLGGKTTRGLQQHFELKPEPADMSGRSWRIHLVQEKSAKGTESTGVARLWLDGQELKFQWLSETHRAKALPLANCGLLLSAGNAKHWLPLCQPKVVEPLVLDLTTQHNIASKVAVELDSAVEPSTLRLRLTTVQGLPKEARKTDKPIAVRESREKGVERAARVSFPAPNNGTVFLTVQFTASGSVAKRLQVELRATGSAGEGQPEQPFNLAMLKATLDYAKADSVRLESQLKSEPMKKAPEPVKQALQNQLNQVKASLPGLEQMCRFAESLHKKASIGFELFTVVEDREVLLATTTGAPQPLVEEKPQPEDDRLDGGEDGKKSPFKGKLTGGDAPGEDKKPESEGARQPKSKVGDPKAAGK